MSRLGGNYQIHLINADGSGEIRLTDNPGPDISVGALFPSWSPDGKRITFTSGRDGSGWKMYAMNADGSALTLETTNFPGYPGKPYPFRWSPDGKRIAFTGSLPDVYVINADGSGETRLTDNPTTDFFPSWSPDGNKIAFVSNRDGSTAIYVMNSDGSAQTRIISISADPDLSLDWGR
jgi:Tol biopolymer transport system component